MCTHADTHGLTDQPPPPLKIIVSFHTTWNSTHAYTWDGQTHTLRQIRRASLRRLASSVPRRLGL
jgi:hypothetical protein